MAIELQPYTQNKNSAEDGKCAHIKLLNSACRPLALTDRSRLPYGNFERYPGFKLYRACTQKFLFYFAVFQPSTENAYGQGVNIVMNTIINLNLALYTHVIDTTNSSFSVHFKNKM